MNDANAKALDTPNWMRSLLLGLMLGVAGGCTPQGSSESTGGSEFLKSFRFADLAAMAGTTQWETLEDKLYDKLPPLSRSPRMGRRVVAQAHLDPSAQDEFVARFQQAVEQSLTAHGATLKGEMGLNKSSTTVSNGVPVSMLLSMPRLFYSVGDIHGVADLWCIAHSGNITVMVSLTEGP